MKVIFKTHNGEILSQARLHSSLSDYYMFLFTGPLLFLNETYYVKDVQIKAKAKAKTREKAGFIVVMNAQKAV